MNNKQTKKAKNAESIIINKQRKLKMWKNQYM